MMKQIEPVKEWLKPFGLVVHACLDGMEDGALPILKSGIPAATLLLIGNAGSSIWDAFSQSPEYADDLTDPLDRWSTRLGNKLATEFSGEVLFPFTGPPFHPFSSWAKRANIAVSSPLGLSLHLDYGLWYGYRLALALPQPIKPVPALSNPINLCIDCSTKPCLNTCPVDAFNDGVYRYQQCVVFLSEHLDGECNKSGCIARHACPNGTKYRYEPEHAQFHMRAFIASQTATDPSLKQE